MGSHKARVGTLSIAAGTDSNVLSNRQLGMARQLIFDCSGEASFASTMTVHVGMKAGMAFADLDPLRITPTAADVVLIANKVNVVEAGGFESVALKAGGTDTVEIPVYAVLEL
jgi:hypothetical protein